MQGVGIWSFNSNHFTEFRTFTSGESISFFLSLIHIYILLLSGVVEHFIAASADLLSSKTAQVKALLLLNLIVVFINISKGFGDHHLHHLTGLFVYLPAVALDVYKRQGLDTVLVLSGVSTRETVKLFPYRPRLILNGVGDIPG